jgi:hypothetical protein
MDEARLVGADMFGQMGQEGDHVMLGHRLDLVDAGDVEFTSLARQTASALALGITPSAAWASQAWASISNQMRNRRVSGDQIATISGRE